MGYSKEFKEKVVARYDRKNNKRAAAAEFGISVDSLSDWLKLREETGSLEKRPIPGRARKVNYQKVKEYFDENSDAYLHEAGEVFGIKPSSVSYILKILKYSYKKNAKIQRKMRAEKNKLSKRD